MPKRINFAVDAADSAVTPAPRQARSRNSTTTPATGWTTQMRRAALPNSVVEAAVGNRFVLGELSNNVRKSAILEEEEESDNAPPTPKYRSLSQPPPITPKLNPADGNPSHFNYASTHQRRQQSPESPKLNIPHYHKETFTPSQQRLPSAAAAAAAVTEASLAADQKPTSRSETPSLSVSQRQRSQQSALHVSASSISRRGLCDADVSKNSTIGGGSGGGGGGGGSRIGDNVITVNGHHYSVLKKIGKGGSSVVYEVFDDECNLRAIKRVDLSQAEEAEAEGYRNEVKVLEKLQGHHRIVRMFEYEYMPDSELLYVVMERGDTDLAALLHKMVSTDSGRKITDVQRKFYWAEMLEAVQAIHECGIIHSDLKPANFLVVAGTLKLIDFGIANAVQSDKTSVVKDTRMGTLSYMSPEAIEDRGGEMDDEDEDDRKPRIKISHKSDVWSLGCILYNLTYGKLPFRGFKMPMKRLEAIVNPNYKIPFPEDGHDPVLLDVIKRCLVRDASMRASVEDLLRHEYLRGEEKKGGNTLLAPSSSAAAEEQNVEALLSRLGHVLTPNTRLGLSRAVQKLSSSDTSLDALRHLDLG
jgi:serine/threonine-protein kinase TTK/MPS1